MKNNCFYRYVYSCIGTARSRKPIKFSKTEEIGEFHFEIEFEKEFPRLLSDKIYAKADFYAEKSLLEDYLMNKYGRDLKFEYSADLIVYRCISDNGYDDVVLEHNFQGLI